VQLLMRTVPDGQSTVIWAQSPSRTRMRDCSIVRRAAGGSWIWGLSWGSFAGRLLGGAGTGRRSLGEGVFF
jgi:hypothetical protein